MTVEIHMRYMNHMPTTICEKPDLLGKDFVVIDPQPEEYAALSCSDCSALLFAHNDREFQKEQAATLEGRLQLPEDRSEHENFLRGIRYALLFSSAFWIVAALIIWAVFFHG